MISAVDLKKKMLIFGFLYLLGWVALSVVVRCKSGIWPELSIGNYLSAVGYAVLIAPIIGNAYAINWLWTQFPILNLLAPNVNGIFALKSDSNFAVLKKHRDAYMGGEGSVQSSGSTQSEKVVGVLEIKMGLFGFAVYYNPEEKTPSRSTSTVINCSFHCTQEPGWFELSYIFRGYVINPLPTDEQNFLGAGLIRVKADIIAPSELNGLYWTNRAYNQGLNTAGQMQAIKST